MSSLSPGRFWKRFAGGGKHVEPGDLSQRLAHVIAGARDVTDAATAVAEILGWKLQPTRLFIIVRQGEAWRYAADYAAASQPSRDREVSVLSAEEQTRLVSLLGSPLQPTAEMPLTGESAVLWPADLNVPAIHSALLTPLAIDSELMGAVVTCYAGTDRPQSQTAVLLDAMAPILAIGLHHAELIEHKRLVGEHEALAASVTSAIRTATGVDAIVNAAVAGLGGALNARKTTIFVEAGEETIRRDQPGVAMRARAEYPAVESGGSLIGTLLELGEESTLGRLLAGEMLTVPEGGANNPILADPTHSTAATAHLLAPIVHLKHLAGVLAIEQIDGALKFSDKELALIGLVSEETGIALYQDGLNREARETEWREASIGGITAAIHNSLDLDTVLQTVVNELGQGLSVCRCALALVEDPISGPLEVSCQYTAPCCDGILPPFGAIPLAGDDLAGLLSPDGPAEIQESPPAAETAQHSRQLRTEGVKASLTAAIRLGGRPIGIISLHDCEKRRLWTRSEIALLQSVVDHTAMAIKNARLFAETTRLASRQSLLSRVLQGMNKSNQIDDIFAAVARELGENLRGGRIMVSRLNLTSGIWVVECQYSNGEVTRPGHMYRALDFAGMADAVDEGLILCADSENDPRFAPYLDRFLRPSAARSFVVVPIRSGGAPSLSIVVSMAVPHAWTEEEVGVLRAAADQLFTAFQRAELFERVLAGKREWETAFDALTDGVFIFDRNGVLCRVNRAGAAMEGKSANDLLGAPCCSLKESVEVDGCRVKSVIRTGQRATFEITPQRLSRALLVSIFPLGGGKPSYDEATFGAVGVVRDLSELRAVEAVAREQREFLVKLIEHANDGIFALSPDGRFVWFNEQLIRQSGYTREELFSSDFRQFLPDADTKLAVDKFTRALGGEAQTFEMHGIRKSGESRLMLVTNTPIYDKGRVSSVLFIARDVTEERIAAERAAQADKLRALGQLASGVAHNFNNILAAILGHAQLIKRDFDDEKLIGRIDIIEKAAVDGAQTVKRIQGFALQQEEPVFDLVDLNQLVQDSANLTRARWVDDAQASGLPYQVDLDLEPLPLTLGTASELREVFVNIILNALDAMPQGGTLNISTEAKDSIVRIRFTDNGVGMSRPVRERIFEPFFTTKGTKGMGLGLAVSNTIVERHGGRIETRSNPGRGSSFTITFPVARTTFKKDQTVAGGEGGSVDILVIDDDRAVGEALAGMLVSAGHRAAQAASGREGLTMMESREFSIVFTDLAMPEMDGWAIASEIKRRWPATRVVLSTGYAISPEVIESHRDLVNAVVLKPIRFDELASTIAQVLS